MEQQCYDKISQTQIGKIIYGNGINKFKLPSIKKLRLSDFLNDETPILYYMKLELRRHCRDKRVDFTDAPKINMTLNMKGVFE